MSEENNAWPYINFVVQPFLVSAAMNYLPMWLAIPAVMFSVVIWVASILVLGSKNV